jgi:hypothetical protein
MPEKILAIGAWLKAEQSQSRVAIELWSCLRVAAIGAKRPFIFNRSISKTHMFDFANGV